MKKALVLCLVLVSAVTMLAGCGNDNKTNNTSSTNSNVSSSVSTQSTSSTSESSTESTYSMPGIIFSKTIQDIIDVFVHKQDKTNTKKKH